MLMEMAHNQYLITNQPTLTKLQMHQTFTQHISQFKLHNHNWYLNPPHYNYPTSQKSIPKENNTFHKHAISINIILYPISITISIPFYSLH